MTPPENLDGMLALTVGELLLMMQRNNAAQYVFQHAEAEAEVAIAVSVGSHAAGLAAAARELLTDARGPAQFPL